jgi:hypothetical protein
MKIGSLLVALAVVLVVVGAGLSYSGYGDSLRVSTVTSTQSFTTTSTKTIASTRTETSIITTSSTLSILDQSIDLQGIKGQGPRIGGYYDWINSTLDSGKVHVSYSSEGGRVDFWMLTEDQFKAYQARHNVEPNVPNIVQKLQSSSYEFTKDIQTSATYYFVFQNQNQGPVSIALHVDGGMRTEVVTTMREQVNYLTQATPFVTQTVSFSTTSVGLGLLFYAGIGLIIVAGIVLAVSRIKHAAPRPPPPVIPASGKFCINCGADLQAGATTCNKCGTKQ